MDTSSKYEHLWDFGMPKERKRGLLRKKNRQMTRKEAESQDNRDDGKTSLTRGGKSK